MNRQLNELEVEDHRPPHQLSEKFFVHANVPKNLGRLDHADGKAKGIGTCGDSIEVFLSIKSNKIKEIRHIPDGCVYTVACASAMSKLVDGQSLKQALEITPEDVAYELDGLPEDHVHCAVLAVNTLGEAIEDYYSKVWGKK